MTILTWWLWIAAIGWGGHALLRIIEAGRIRPLPTLAETGAAPGALPHVSVIVPARDEAARIETTARRLLAQRGVNLDVVVVDDRSSDGTTEALASLLAEHRDDGRFRVARIDALPEGWLGKCHACHVGSREARGEWLLFTDADIWLSDEAIARGVAAGVREGVDHICLIPGVDHATTLGKGALMSFSLAWVTHASRVNRDRPRSCVGVGAFNLVRAETYRRFGGHERLRMEVIDDLKLGLLVRASGGRTRVFIGGRDVDADWGASLPGMVRDLEKNYFAVLGFRLWLAALVVLAFACAWLPGALGPILGLAFGGPALLAGFAAFAGLMANAIPTAMLAVRMGWSARHAVLAPLLIAILPVALANSAIRTTLRGGIRWRDHFYPTNALKAGLVTWKNAADLTPGRPGEKDSLGIDR